MQAACMLKGLVNLFTSMLVRTYFQKHNCYSARQFVKGEQFILSITTIMITNQFCNVFNFKNLPIPAVLPSMPVIGCPVLEGKETVNLYIWQTFTLLDDGRFFLLIALLIERMHHSTFMFNILFQQFNLLFERIPGSIQVTQQGC